MTVVPEPASLSLHGMTIDMARTGPDPQALIAPTVTCPAALPNFTRMEVEPCPDWILAPCGTVHTYEVAPFTEAIEYVAVCLLQTLAGPVMVPGWEGSANTKTAMELESETLQFELIKHEYVPSAMAV